MKELKPKRVIQNVDRYLKKARNHDHRYASFDYCFNYFHNLKEKGIACNSPERVEQSCMQLAFFLASWGMLRGGTTLLWKSAHFYQRILEVIAECRDEVWEIDLPYNRKQIELLRQVAKKLRNALRNGKKDKPTDTQVTKIMLGVFANVPAFDTNVKAVFGGFNKKTLQSMTEFYEQEEIKAVIGCASDGPVEVGNELVSRHDRPIYTLDFSGDKTQRCYTKAKILDMVGFVEGMRRKKEQEARRKRAEKKKNGRIEPVQ